MLRAVVVALCLAVPGATARWPSAAKLAQPRGITRPALVASEASQPVPARSAVREFCSKNSFPIGMAVAVAAAHMAPWLGETGGPLRPELTVGKLGCSTIFFLSSLSLRLSDLTKAATSVRLNALVQLTSLGAWPAVTWCMVALMRALGAPFSSGLLDGLLVTACLPTTVNMCVLMTQKAGGNVALAITNAVIANTLGVFVTPLLLFSVLGKTIDVKFAAVCMQLASRVLLPVLLGQLARNSGTVTAFASTHKKGIKYVSELIILGVIFNTFCDSFSRASLALGRADILLLALGMPVVYTLCFLCGARLLSRLPIAPADATAALYCASQKTLAFGLPVIRLIFAGSPDLAYYTAPIMVLHPLQLFLGSALMPTLKRTLKLEHAAE
ncbi:putative sodium bile acid cotransporter [Pavlovales sp. CCMP2436]|nr:putative sodium bile acid cotransporter [Pavlovales sp. CCMP2436]